MLLRQSTIFECVSDECVFAVLVDARIVVSHIKLISNSENLSSEFHMCECDTHVCVNLCVCERERDYISVRVWVCVCVCVCVSV